MLVVGTQVRIADTFGRIVSPDPSAETDAGWLVEWESGHRSAHSGSELINVEMEEHGDAIAGITEADLCPSRFSLYTLGDRRCSLRKGHRTLNHSRGEVGWTDEMADSG